jgi:crescentin
MSTLSTIFGRKGMALAGEKAAQPYSGTEPTSSEELSQPERPASERWAEIGLRVGSDNEELRNLMLDTGRRIGALDDLRETFDRLAGPIDQTLRALERETSDNVSLRGTLDELRSSYETLRAEFKELSRKFAAKETESERLRHELSLSQQSVAGLEARKIELLNELEPARTKLSELDSQLAREVATTRMLTDHKQSLSDHAAASDKRIAELEGAIGSAREKLVLWEDENRSLQASLDQIVGENSRLSRRLTESEAALEKARLQLEQMKTALNTAESDRSKLGTAIDEANDRRQVETNTLSTRLEAMSSRTLAAEKLLAEVRQSLLSRTEENSAAERKVVEATIARNLTDKKLELLQNNLQVKERQLQELEQSRAKLVERTNTLLKTVKMRDTVLARAEERIQALSERVNQLESDADTTRSKSEESIEEFKSQLQHERLERTVAEGALRKARISYAELQRDLDDYVRHSGNQRSKIQARPTPKDLTLAQGTARSPKDLALTIAQAHARAIPDDDFGPEEGDEQAPPLP